jgi:hypothetical protein
MRKIGTFLTKNFITCQLRGRTGNMMFEIAHGYAKSLEYNRQFVVPSSESSSGHLEKNLFRKVDFNIPFSNQDSKSKVINGQFYYEKLIPFENEPTVFSGYYQSEKYFGEYSEVIKDLYSPTLEFINKATTEFPFFNNSTVGAINVRRGDYLTQPRRHPVITLDYINEAYKHLPKCDYILILSDDIKWCKENILLPNNVIFVENYWDHEGIWLLSLCDHFIISNSTFSWWGAWLSRTENKVVISPDTWFGPDVIEDPKDVWCDDWIRIPTKWVDGFLELKN